MANVDKMYTYLRGFLSGAGMNEALNALQYARKAHEGQMRRDGTPYIVHPLGMACNRLCRCDDTLLYLQL